MCFQPNRKRSSYYCSLHSIEREQSTVHCFSVWVPLCLYRTLLESSSCRTDDNPSRNPLSQLLGKSGCVQFCSAVSQIWIQAQSKLSEFHASQNYSSHIRENSLSADESILSPFSAILTSSGLSECWPTEREIHPWNHSIYKTVLNSDFWLAVMSKCRVLRLWHLSV